MNDREFNAKHFRMWPLVKRYGLICGALLYLKCKHLGHRWACIGQPDPIGAKMVGVVAVSSGRIKATCRRCSSTKIVTIHLRRYPGGRQEVITDDGYPVRIIKS